jgi:hypothetical protein
MARRRCRTRVCCSPGTTAVLRCACWRRCDRAALWWSSTARRWLYWRAPGGQVRAAKAHSGMRLRAACCALAGLYVVGTARRLGDLPWCRRRRAPPTPPASDTLSRAQDVRRTPPRAPPDRAASAGQPCPPRRIHVAMQLERQRRAGAATVRRRPHSDVTGSRKRASGAVDWASTWASQKRLSGDPSTGLLMGGEDKPVGASPAPLNKPFSTSDHPARQE